MNKEPDELPSITVQIIATVIVFAVGFWIFGGRNSQESKDTHSKPAAAVNSNVKESFVAISVLTEACPITPDMRGKAMTVLMGLARLSPQTVARLQPDVDAAVASFHGKSEGTQIGTCVGYETLVRRLM